MAPKRPPLIVTRHLALVEYIREIGLVPGEVEVMPRADYHDVAGRVVYGVLPYGLAACAESLVYIPIFPPNNWPKKIDYTIEEIRKWAGRPVIYTVRGQTLIQDPNITDFRPTGYP